MTLLLLLSCSIGFALTPPDGVLEYLRLSETAQRLLREANQVDLDLRSGATSKTDFIATRIQGAAEPSYWRTVLTLSDDAAPLDQAIDLVHELTHVLGPRVNPYDPTLSLTRYVRMGIEGEGGEGHAIETECRVARELLSKVSARDGIRLRRRCAPVWGEQTRGPFWYRVLYYVGSEIDSLGPLLRSLPLRSIEAPLISAAARKPYPLALAEEYLEITSGLCQRLEARVGDRLSHVDQEILKHRCSGADQREANLPRSRITLSMSRVLPK